ncbi:unnamed protein product, partial [Didymodactylos carnosus]
IKISVDFDELPKMVLPFALNLNPGLPAYVQQQIVKQELQRRQDEAADTITTNPIIANRAIFQRGGLGRNDIDILIRYFA